MSDFSVWLSAVDTFRLFGSVIELLLVDAFNSLAFTKKGWTFCEPAVLFLLPSLLDFDEEFRLELETFLDIFLEIGALFDIGVTLGMALLRASSFADNFAMTSFILRVFSVFSDLFGAGIKYEFLIFDLFGFSFFTVELNETKDSKPSSIKSKDVHVFARLPLFLSF